MELFEQGKFSVGCNYWASHAGTNMWSDWRPDVLETLFYRGIGQKPCFVEEAGTLGNMLGDAAITARRMEQLMEKVREGAFLWNEAGDF